MPLVVLARLGRARPLLAQERLDYLLAAVSNRRGLRGSVVEIGCFRGGTALVVNRALRALNAERPYVCIDTFEGFVEEQFEADERRGTPSRARHAFDVNSRATVERMFRRHGLTRVELIRGDIVELPESALPDEVCVALVDVDLAAPTLSGLGKLYPRLVPGGIILVDNCDARIDAGWRARQGYARFCAEEGRPEIYEVGFGLVHG